MCGIVGYSGARACSPILLDGLAALEYRGYDSAGVALAHPAGGVETIRSVGNLEALRGAVAARRVPAGVGADAGRPEPTAGIGHTRWATHGAVTEANAHPHADETHRVHIVLNGIVENHVELRRALEADGTRFAGQTDAEVVAHLVGALYEDDLAAAVAATAERLKGHFAFVAVAADRPGLLVGTRRACPLVVGVGQGEAFVASAVPAFAAHTRRVVEIREGELVILDEGRVTVLGRPDAVDHAVLVTEDRAPRGKDGWPTHMRREVAEQPAGIAATVFAHLAEGRGADIGLDDAQLARLRGVRIIGCGTSFHAGLAARELFEEWAGIPVEVEVASEHRHRTVLHREDELVICISQSGETADTLAALRSARAAGVRVIALTNDPDSQAARDADAVLLTRAGLEVSVAATKTFTAQVAALSALALRLAGARGRADAARRDELAAQLAALPDLFERTIAQTEAWAERVAHSIAGSPLVMYLGRQSGAAIAMEGALKLKEVAYIPADAYPAGEMKHGPIALLGPGTPVVVVATGGAVQEKLHSNMAEVRARGAWVLAVACETDRDVVDHADDVVRLPYAAPALQALLAVVPLQLLALHVATVLGLDVDQPRNLAKTVTVE